MVHVASRQVCWKCSQSPHYDIFYVVPNIGFDLDGQWSKPIVLSVWIRLWLRDWCAHLKMVHKPTKVYAFWSNHNLWPVQKWMVLSRFSFFFHTRARDCALNPVHLKILGPFWACLGPEKSQFIQWKNNKNTIKEKKKSCKEKKKIGKIGASRVGARALTTGQKVGLRCSWYTNGGLCWHQVKPDWSHFEGKEPWIIKGAV